MWLFVYMWYIQIIENYLSILIYAILLQEIFLFRDLIPAIILYAILLPRSFDAKPVMTNSSKSWELITLTYVSHSNRKRICGIFV